jgi:single-strand DNA-binding protein
MTISPWRDFILFAKSKRRYPPAAAPFTLCSADGGQMLKAQLVGNLGSDPEMRYSGSGTPMLQFNVASNYRAKNLAGNWDDLTEWVRVTIFGARAEKLAELLKKGQRIYCDGRLEARPWSGKDGSLRAGLEMIASDVEFMGARNDGQQPAAAGTPRGAAIPTDDRGDLEDLPF